MLGSVRILKAIEAVQQIVVDQVVSLEVQVDNSKTTLHGIGQLSKSIVGVVFSLKFSRLTK